MRCTYISGNAASTLASLVNTKLDATAYNASDVLSKIKTVDGAGSGLDADMLDGQSGAYYLNYANFTSTPVIPSTVAELSDNTSYALKTYVTAAINAQTLFSGAYADLTGKPSILRYLTLQMTLVSLFLLIQLPMQPRD